MKSKFCYSLFFQLYWFVASQYFSEVFTSIVVKTISIVTKTKIFIQNPNNLFYINIPDY